MEMGDRALIEKKYELPETTLNEMRTKLKNCKVDFAIIALRNIVRYCYCP